MPPLVPLPALPRAGPLPKKKWLNERFFNYLQGISQGKSQADSLQKVSTDKHPPKKLGLLFYEHLPALQAELPTDMAKELWKADNDRFPSDMSKELWKAVSDLAAGTPDWPPRWVEKFPGDVSSRTMLKCRAIVPFCLFPGPPWCPLKGP